MADSTSLWNTYTYTDGHAFTDPDSYTHADTHSYCGWFSDADAYLHTGSVANRAVHGYGTTQPSYGSGGL